MIHRDDSSLDLSKPLRNRHSFGAFLLSGVFGLEFCSGILSFAETNTFIILDFQLRSIYLFSTQCRPLSSYCISLSSGGVFRGAKKKEKEKKKKRKEIPKWPIKWRSSKTSLSLSILGNNTFDGVLGACTCLYLVLHSVLRRYFFGRWYMVWIGDSNHLSTSWGVDSSYCSGPIEIQF